jgi:uncharacterized protein (DUF2384 family)
MTDPDRISPDSIAALQARFQGHSQKAQTHYAVMHEARQVFGGDEAADNWMRAPLAALDGRTPAELVKDGRIDDVLACIRNAQPGKAR